MSQATLGSAPYRNSNLFSGYYLDERVADLDAWDCDEEATAAFEEIRDLWETEGSLLPGAKEDELIDTWIAEVLDVLGFGSSSEVTLPDGGGYVDRLLFETDDARREAAKRARDGDVDGQFSRALAVLEAKQWDADFEARFAEQRSYRDASHQIKYYLERTPGDLNWGVLTDGKTWRLYGTKDYETQTYYEVDLPEILESGSLEAFKYFYVFFRPEAFVETAGSSFLDDVWTESETAAQELGEDLQDNVFRALRVLGKGFVESNDLDIDPDDEDARDELKEQSLVLLYRLMFVLYAESRGLIDPDDPDASEEYQENFSLEAKREQIIDEVDGLDVESGAAFADEFSSYSSSIWGRLTELFELIDEGEEDLDVPPYNGGLFSREDHAFLTDHEVADPYIAEVIFWLSTTENEAGEHVPADYADLDTRHLGSIYEGLLEHEFRIAGAEGVAAVSEDGGQVWKPAGEVSVADAVEVVDEGGLYVVNDEGERKATGAYYTPDYVVTYIVEETVDPLIDEIDADLRERGLEPSDREYFLEFYQAVKGLTVLDPAMGSGHFLTKATGYLTEQVMAVVREQEIGSYDEQQIRREISKEVIYGVDINGMAVELAKLSMWLETLAADQPLAFLDHHLKAGNSLVGSDITEVLSEDGGDDDTGQITLTQAFARVRQDTLEHVMELMADLLAFDNETLDDVKSMEELYDEIREDPLYKRLFELANVHTAEEFGCDVPEGAYEEMAGAIEDAEDWEGIKRGGEWFRNAQAIAEEQDFFHWELEYPEVFFGRDGERLDGAGFDVSLGNPPYVRSRNVPDEQKEYYKESFRTLEGAFDLYILFIEQSHKIAHSNSFIVPNKWTTTGYGRKIRDALLDDYGLSDVLNVSDLDVFPDADIYPIVYTTAEDPQDSVRIHSVNNPNNLDDAPVSEVPRSFIDSLGDRVLPIELEPDFTPIAERVMDETGVLGNWISMTEAIHTGNMRDELIVSESSGPECEPLIGGSEIDRYEIEWEGRWIRYDPEMIEESDDGYGDLRDRELFERDEKLFIRDISYRPVAVYDDQQYFALNTLYSVSSHDEFDHSLRFVESIFNSEFVNKFFRQIYGGTHVSGGYLRFKPMFSYNIPVPTDERLKKSNSVTDNPIEKLSSCSETIEAAKSQKQKLNLSLSSHFGDFECVNALVDPGLVQPVGDSSSRLYSTTKEYPNLRIGTATVDRESPNTALIKATARYKPDDEDAHETDRWGYTETDLLPAFRITDLTETEADLIEHFVPVAVDEAGGFANFRETATKTNSLVDRLQAIELPDPDDVADDLANYLRTVERAEELDAKIERTDDLIDEIVYELYGLTDEEIEIVEEAVGE